MSGPVLRSSTDEDPRLVKAAREYLAELEAGRRPDRDAWLRRYPDIAGAVAECLDGIELAQALRPSGESPSGEPSGSPLGDFQLLREIGRGGMGVVYEAVQLSLGRRVALKVLPFAAALDARQLRRFRTEAQAAALLHHSNIVPVHAVGCERGVHFYAMQLIEGRSLDAVIRERRGEGPEALARPATSGWFRTVAEVGAEVAGALDYAHGLDVIHRDIKPGNLLLDAAGRAWVTDFGLAQVSAEAGLTRTGDMVGTLRYMSPEQVAGRRAPVDARTDVYSLGATLYEMATLHPVFPESDRAALVRRVLDTDPLPLRAMEPAVPDELEIIIQKALSKAPGDRYASAGEMAADLRRFLERRPILARRPTLADRCRKWIRRHPSAVAATALVLILAIAGLGAATALVSREQARTRAALGRERERAREVEARFDLARRVADDLVRIADEELADNPFFEGLRKRLLEAALTYYREFIALRENDPEARAALAATRDRVTEILEDLAALQGDRQMYLLEESSVLDDLGLTADQRVLIADVVRIAGENRRERFEGLRQSQGVPRARDIVEEARVNEAALGAILTAAQTARLRQIQVQCRGVSALLEPDIAGQLRLSAADRERIREVEFELARAGRERGRSRRGGAPPPDRDRTSADTTAEAAMERAVALLSDAQRARWNEIAGPPFTGRLTRPPFLPGGAPMFRPPR